ncbi:hypothetical protein ACFFIX_14855 [Metabacillus herbersteinensis]|uniref:N-formylglutamate amidohydrolase n=1 Tax=Metabacillus herbersteinensis TaxID=283816 RepID=A0ABV6GGW8_9BACI
MSLKFIQQNYLKYNKGKGFICGHVDALHATPPAADVFTDKIVESLIKKTGCAGIISSVSRNEADLNRSPNGDNDHAIKEYRDAVKKIVEFLNILDDEQNHITQPYLHLSFHGMKDTHYGPYGIEIGTVHGQSCSPIIKKWFLETITRKASEILPEIEIVFDEKFIGDESIVYHRLGDGIDYSGYHHHFHTFQIEISRTIRSKHRSKIITIFSHMINEFQKNFVNNYS